MPSKLYEQLFTWYVILPGTFFHVVDRWHDTALPVGMKTPTPIDNLSLRCEVFCRFELMPCVFIHHAHVMSILSRTSVYRMMGRRGDGWWICRHRTTPLRWHTVHKPNTPFNVLRVLRFARKYSTFVSAFSFLPFYYLVQRQPNACADSKYYIEFVIFCGGTLLAVVSHRTTLRLLGYSCKLF